MALPFHFGVTFLLLTSLLLTSIESRVVDTPSNVGFLDFDDDSEQPIQLVKRNAEGFEVEHLESEVKNTGHDLESAASHGHAWKKGGGEEHHKKHHDKHGEKADKGSKDYAYQVEVHFENKDGGFFIKHTPRQHFSGEMANMPPALPPAAGSILSIDRFTVFQNTQPISIRATYGPFSTKQTVPARYIVPDPVDSITVATQQQKPSTSTNSTKNLLLEMQELSAAATHHLDMSAHIVLSEIPRDTPVMRVLFHTGTDPGGRRLLFNKHQRVCIVLHASLPGRIPLTSTCSPDGEDGVCVAQVTIPSSWWPPLTPPDSQLRPVKTPTRYVQAAYSILEPKSDGNCIPRVQIQPVTALGQIPLVQAKSNYKELRADEHLTMLIPHVALYPLSRVHIPVFLQEKLESPIQMFIVRARVKSGIRILSASSSTPRWNVTVDINQKHTTATITAVFRGQEEPQELDSQDGSVNNIPNIVEIFTWLLEVSEDSTELWDGARIVWSVRYITSSPVSSKQTSIKNGTEPLPLGPSPSGSSSSNVASNPLEQLGPLALPSHDAASIDGLKDLKAGLDKDEKFNKVDKVHVKLKKKTNGINASPGVTVISEDKEAPPKTHHHLNVNHNENRKKLTARFEIQKDDIQAVLPISKNWEIMNTAVLTGRQVSQAMKVFIVSQAGKAADVTLQSSCHSEDESVLKVSSSCSSVYVDGSEARGSVNGSILVKYGTYVGLASFTVWMPEFPLEINVPDVRLSQVKMWKVPDSNHVSTTKSSRIKRSFTWSSRDGVSSSNVADLTNPSSIPDDMINKIDHSSSCHLRYQQTPIDVYGRFMATDHDSGRISYFVSRRTWLRVTDLVSSLLRVSDPRFATLRGRILQGRSMGRTEVQVLSPITGRVIGAKEIRVVNDKISLVKLHVNVVSGLQLNISPDSSIDNGYVAETSVSKKLTAQYQEGLLDIEVEFSDGSRTPLRDIDSNDYHLVVESLDSDIVAFAPMVASHHPRVIAVGEGSGDLLKITLMQNEDCRLQLARAKASAKYSSGVLSQATAYVQVDFSMSDILQQRPDFVQNDGGTYQDLRDILIGIPLKDEEDDPSAQVRQFHSMMGRNVIRSGRGANIAPLEIGMYILLGAFCFAIMIFVVSCVVYASKYKQPGAELMTVDPKIHASTRGMNNFRARDSRKSRPTTINAHDWIWLGRATLDRNSCHVVPSNNNNEQMRITSNPIMLNYAEPDDCVVTGFHNPNHVELPSRVCDNIENGNTGGVSHGQNQRSGFRMENEDVQQIARFHDRRPVNFVGPVPASTDLNPRVSSISALTQAPGGFKNPRTANIKGSYHVKANPLAYGVTDEELNNIDDDSEDISQSVSVVDSTTYTKRDRDGARQTPERYQPPKIDTYAVVKAHKNRRTPLEVTEETQLKPLKKMESPPPLPPHGPKIHQVDSTENYKPPVPPHRVSLSSMSSSSNGSEVVMRKHHRHHHHKKGLRGDAGVSCVSAVVPRVPTMVVDPPNSAFVFDDAAPASTLANDILKITEDDDGIDARDVDFARGSQSEGVGDLESLRGEVKDLEMEDARTSTTPHNNAQKSVKSDGKATTKPDLEDLELDMDYEQIMHYFDNLKESNA